MPVFRLRSDSGPVSLFAPSDAFDGLHVEPGETVTVPGEIYKTTDDAVIVGKNQDDPRSWPTSMWELVADSDTHQGE